MSRRRRDVFEVVGAPAAILVVYFLTPLDRSVFFGMGVGVFTIALATPLALARARSVRISDSPVRDAAQAIVLFGTVLVIGFATLYKSIASHTDGQIHGLATKIDALYFTMTILSTVGFGDVTATGQLARGIVTLNITFNLVSLGVTLRLLTFVARQRVEEQGIEIAQRPPDAP